jgi:site-specific DNA recombinase
MLGYDIDPAGGRLLVNEGEAERVRVIFTLFEENRSILLTLTEIERQGWRLKSWTRKTGQFRAGAPFAANSLRRLLTNIIYTGEIRHKGQPYPGERRVSTTLRHSGLEFSEYFRVSFVVC